MSTCNHLGPLISGYLDGALSRGKRRRVERHLSGCGECRATLEKLTSLQHHVESLSFGEIPEPTWRSIMDALNQPNPEPALRPSRRPLLPFVFGGVAAAAAAAVLVVAGLSFFGGPRDDRQLASRAGRGEDNADTAQGAAGIADEVRAGDLNAGADASGTYEYFRATNSLGAQHESLRLAEADELLVFEAERAGELVARFGEALLVDGTEAGRRVFGLPESEVGRGDRLADGESAPLREGVEGEAVAGPPPATQGALRARDGEGNWIGEFPLEHTEVDAEVSGYLARTVVEQRYVNDFDQVIEAVYVFPLPNMAAVNDFVMEIGERRIVGIVRPREEAERIYAEARARGQTASLLTQERPNLFTQNVANIEAGGEVVIRITYFERLPYEDGRYSYVFPMVVGPRYIPGYARGEGSGGQGEETTAQVGGGGTSPPTDQVPDAQRITPPVLPPGMRSGHDIGLTLTLHAGFPVQSMECVTHEIEVEEVTPARRVIRLSEQDAIPNRDFILSWSVAGDETQFGVIAHAGSAVPEGMSGGFFSLMMQPTLTPADHEVCPREITFIMDTSGSMNGVPIEMSKGIVSRSLDAMRPHDLFNIVFFAGSSGQLWDRPRPCTPENMALARDFMKDMVGSGGTEMLAGLQQALSAQHEPEYLQMYVFLTDGYIGNEEAILGTIREEGGDARFFAFGPGSSVNRYLLDGIGELGHGATHYANPRDNEHADRAVRTFFAAIDSPVLVDIAVDWNGLPVDEVYPKEIGDLFAGQTIDLVGRFTEAAQGTAFITGRIGEEHVRIPVEVNFPAEAEQHAALAAVWARHKIHDLSTAMLGAAEGDRERIETQITDLAVDFRLVSPFTAFVAVDESRVVGGGRPLRILQPVEIPENVRYETAVGVEPVGEPVRIAAWNLTLILGADGRVYVAEATVLPGHRRDAGATRTEVEAGAVLAAINRTVVTGLRHVESLLLQAAGPNVSVTFEPGGEVELPLP